jgi:hypothetical protein
MGVVREFLRDVFSVGLRRMNNEINEQAVQEGLITPRSAEEPDSSGTHCRPDFEPLYQQLTGPDRNAGPA